MQHDRQNILEAMTIAARRTRGIFFAYWGTDDFVMKNDEEFSQLTVADSAIQESVRQFLGRIFPDIPLVGEEDDPETIDRAQRYPRLFRIDPIDGTWNYTEGRHGCTLELTYEEDGVPVAAVSYQPSKNRLLRSITDDRHAEWLGTKASRHAIKTHQQPRVADPTRPPSIEILMGASESTHPFRVEMSKYVGAAIKEYFDDPGRYPAGALFPPLTRASGLRLARLASAWEIRHGHDHVQLSGQGIAPEQATALASTIDHKAPTDGFVHYAMEAFRHDFSAGIHTAREAGCYAANMVETPNGITVRDPGEDYVYGNLNFVVANSYETFRGLAGVVESASAQFIAQQRSASTRVEGKQLAAPDDFGRSILAV